MWPVSGPTYTPSMVHARTRERIEEAERARRSSRQPAQAGHEASSVRTLQEDAEIEKWVVGTRFLRSVTSTRGVGIRPALGPRGRCGAGWLEDWLVVVRARLLARRASVGSGKRLRGSETDGPGRACLARLGSACDCDLCVPGVCLCGSVPVERSVTSTRRVTGVASLTVQLYTSSGPHPQNCGIQKASVAHYRLFLHYEFSKGLGAQAASRGTQPRAGTPLS